MEVVGTIILGLFIILIGAVLIAVQFACTISNALENYKEDDEEEII